MSEKDTDQGKSSTGIVVKAKEDDDNGKVYHRGESFFHPDETPNVKPKKSATQKSQAETDIPF